MSDQLLMPDKMLSAQPGSTPFVGQSPPSSSVSHPPGVREVPRTPLAPPPSSSPTKTAPAGLPAELPPAGCPKLSGALAAARDRCKAAAKSSENLHHNYKYASADEVIATASDALEGSGLALLPLCESMAVVGSGNFAFYALTRLLILSHASGEFVPLRVENFPVIPDRGKPLDKAYAIALTTSLAYKLRDLLQMPRGTDDDDVAAQDDRGARAPVSAPVSAPEGAPEGVDPRSPIGTKQVDRIARLVTQLGLSWDAFNGRLAAVYGIGGLRGLNVRQADEVERKLDEHLARRQAAVRT